MKICKKYNSKFLKILSFLILLNFSSHCLAQVNPKIERLNKLLAVCQKNFISMNEHTLQCGNSRYSKITVTITGDGREDVLVSMYQPYSNSFKYFDNNLNSVMDVLGFSKKEKKEINSLIEKDAYSENQGKGVLVGGIIVNRPTKESSDMYKNYLINILRSN